ncbi:MAG: CARDB domain-containing protein, partial [Haloplanus sp.]
SPGVVPSAVTVGASDDADDIAYFSSRGPTPLRDYTKPDLVAPGYSIYSADAGTDGYTSKSGTSMATPVVSGGAALVIEAGGDPTPTEVKSRLVTTTDDIGDYDVYTAGSGRLNASRAIEADVVIDRPTTDFQDIPAGETERRTLRIENVGEETRTVNVSASATSLDGNDGSVSVNRTQVTLSPGETADVALEVTADTGQGTYSGRVQLDEYTANFGYLVDAKYELTVEKSAIDGTDVSGDTVFLHDHDRDGASTTDSISSSDGSEGEASVGVLDGNYTVYTAGIDESTGQPVIMGKQVTVTGSTTLTFDESQTVTYSLDTSDPESVDGELDPLRLHGRLGTVDGTYTYYQMWRTFPDDRAVRFSTGEFNASVAHLLAPAGDHPDENRHLDTPTAYHLFHQTQGVAGDETFVVDRDGLAAENVTYYRDSSGQTYDLERVVDNPVLNDPIGTGQWSLRDRETQTVYSTPGDGATEPSYRLELADDDGDWTIGSADGYAPAGGIETPVTANRHPFTGTASVDVGDYPDRDDVSLFVNPQVSQAPIRGVLDTSDATTDYTVTRDGSVVDQGQTDGRSVSYSADGTVSEGTTYEITADADNGDRSLSTRTRTAVRTTYADGGDNAPPSVESVSAPELSAQSSLPTGPVGVDVTVDDDDLENVTVLVRYADGTVTSDPYDGSITDTDAGWHDASVTAVDAAAGEYRATIDTDLGTDTVHLEVAVLDDGGNAISTAAYDAFAVDSREADGVVVSSATLSNSTIAAGETAEATATVENTGDATAEFDAEFRLTADGQVSTVASRTVTLDPGESRTVTLSGTVSEAGTYDADVSGEPAGQLTVEGPAVFELSGGSLNASEITAGESTEATATVENLGDESGTFTAELVVNGTVESTADVALAGGESTTVSFEYVPPEAGDYDLSIAGSDGDGGETVTDAGLLTVLEPATLAVGNPALEDAEILAGETTAATATIENVGEAEGTFTVELTADDGSGAEVRNETTVALAGGESATVRLESTFQSTGEYAIEIGGEYAGDLAVVESNPAAFETTGVSLSQNPILEGESVAVEATVENVGDETGDHTAVLYVDGEQADTEQISLAGGESTTVSFTETFVDADDYAITVDDAAPVTLTVDQPATFDVIDPKLNETTVLEGETVALTADVENVGDREGTYTAEFRTANQVVDEREVTLGAGERETITLSATFDDAGEYDVSFGDEPAGTLAVEEPATFAVSDADLNDTDVETGESVAVTATIENTGDRDGTFEAELRVDGTVAETGSVDVAAGSTETITFDRAFESAGEYEISVNETAAGTLTVTDPDPAAFETTGVSLGQNPILEGESVTITATVENVGGETDDHTATLYVDGDAEGSTTVTLAPGESTTVSFDRAFEETGSYEVAVDEAGPATLDVERDAAFDVRDAQLSDATILEGEPVEVTATVENVGDREGAHTVELLVDGTVIDSTDVTLAGGGSQTVSFEETFANAGSYDIAVDDVQAGSLTVEQPATFSVTNADLSATEVATGESVGISATIENTGDRAGTFEADLAVDGTVVESTPVEVAAGGAETVTFDRVFEDGGEYDLGVSGTVAGTLTVTEPDPAEFRTTGVTLSEDPILEGESVTIEATVENVGNGPGEHAATLFLDGEKRATETVSLDAGETTTVAFTESVAEAGNYSVAVDDADPVALAVEADASLSIVEATLPRNEITEGENATVETTVENVGDREGTKTLELRTENETLTAENVTLAPGEATNATLVHAFADAGEYELFVDDYAVGNLTVLAADDGTGDGTDGGDDADDGGNTGGAPGGGGSPGGGSSGGAPGGGSSGGSSPGAGAPPVPDEGAEASEPSVSIDRSKDRSTISVTDPSSSDPVDVELDTGDAGNDGDGSFVHSGLQLRLGEGAGDFELEVSPPADGPREAPEPADHRAIGYVQVEKNGIGNEDIEEARFEFAVEESDLPEGNGPDDVRMLRYHDGEWQELETQHEGDGVYSAVSPGFSEFAVAVEGAEAPGGAAFEFARIEVPDGSVAPGDEVRVSATIENVGDSSGTEEVGLVVDGDVVESTAVSLAPNASRRVTLSTSFDAPGTYEVGIA